MSGENRQLRKRIASVYASALYELAQERGSLYLVGEQLLFWKDLISRQPGLQKIFTSAMVSKQERQELLAQIEESPDSLVGNFLSVMNCRDRLGILPEVIEAFLEQDERQNNRVRVTVTTAEAIDPHLNSQIHQALERYFDKEVIVDHRVRPEILGGLIVRADDLLIDGSVKSRLSALQKHLMKRGEDELQSRRNFIRY